MSRRTYEKHPSFDPVLSRGIISIILVLAAAVIILSFFDQAGPLGYILNDGVLSFLFGRLRYAAPALLLVIAWFVIKDIEYDYRGTHGIGSLLFFLALGGIMHLAFAPSDMWNEAVLGHGGGALGMIAWPLKTYLGAIAGALILTGLLLVSLLLIVNTLIVHVLSAHKKITAHLGAIGRSIFAVLKRITETAPADTAALQNGWEETYEEETAGEPDEDRDEQFTIKKVGGDANSLLGDEDDSAAEEKNNAEEVEDEPADATEFLSETGEPARAWGYKTIVRELPPLTLLSSKRGKPTSGDIKANSEIIKETLREFGMEVDMGEVRVGPTVTQYTLKPQKGIKLSRLTGLSNDLALALAAHPIRIEAPIPGKSLVGIEVPNEKVATVTFKELLEAPEFAARPHNTMIALGKDVAGKTWFADLPRMPHLLIAGATGSGKTVCVNTIIMSLLYQNTAETLRFIMVDPKRVELTLYNGIPHLMTPVITNVAQTVNALRWTIAEMERRFELLERRHCRDIHSYNARHPGDKLPHIIFAIDELADLMAAAAGEVEAGIIRLAQMARAVGIHLILATQRPSVDVITGLMKANIPARIAFSVASLVDSRTILDSPGAEKLLGRGDMLFQTAELSKPVRIQGAFISEDELTGVVDYLKGDESPEYDISIISKQAASGTANMFGGPNDSEDPLFADAKRAITEAGKASASFLQRKFKIGYARAARILDELEIAGIIGPADHAKPREILATETEIDDTMNAGGSEFREEKEIETQTEEEAPTKI